MGAGCGRRFVVAGWICANHAELDRVCRRKVSAAGNRNRRRLPHHGSRRGSLRIGRERRNYRPLLTRRNRGWKRTMRVDQYFEDYVEGEQGTNTGRTITEADIVIHAGQTGDFYPHHMDAEWCKTQPIGQRVAHGTLVFSVAVGMTAGAVNPRALSYGYDRLRFVKPVFIGDTPHVGGKAKERKPHTKRTTHRPTIVL